MEKYTVIIPVRDSAETIRYTLETCLRQTYENYEVVVSDNFSSDDTRDIVLSIRDSRLKYINTGRRVSMSENFDFALSHVTEGYVMFIGGDDGLMPGAIDYVNDIVLKTGVKAVSGRWAHYMWPNFPDETLRGNIKVCGFGHESNLRGGVELRSPAEWVRKTLSFETQYVYELANLYYGFVHRDVIDKSVKDGVYFRSVTPDAYSAFATTLNIDKYAFSYRPFCICGASGKSNGASAFHEKSKLDEAKKFTVENTLPIHGDFVYCSSLEIIVAEAFSQFSDAFPIVCGSLKVDQKLMLQRALASVNSKTKPEVLRAVELMSAAKGIDYSSLKPIFAQENVSKLSKVVFRLRSLYSGFFCYIGVRNSVGIGINNVSEASIVLGLLVGINCGAKVDTVKDGFLHWLRSFLLGGRK